MTQARGVVSYYFTTDEQSQFKSERANKLPVDATGRLRETKTWNN